jgi:hypothetical protein
MQLLLLEQLETEMQKVLNNKKTMIARFIKELLLA